VPAARLKAFQSDITRARDLVALGQAIGTMTRGVVDGTDLYRAALVQSIAAWDRYIHGVVLDRSVEIVLGKRQGGQSRKIGLPFAAIAEIMSAANPIDQEVRAHSLVATRLSLETFQQPDDVAKALAMVDVRSLWSSAFKNAEQAKTAIGVIVHRRNQIVHACDADPIQPNAVLPLTDSDALNAVDTVDTSVHAIDACCVPTELP
jgi:hypothetical protein